MSSHVPPPGLEPFDPRSLTRSQWQARKRAHKLDRAFFRQNPLRLTRVRPALEGETEDIALFPGKRCFVVVRQVRAGAHHGLFIFTVANLVEVASSESKAAELYDLMLEDEQREWAAKSKEQALGELLARALVQGEA